MNPRKLENSEIVAEMHNARNEIYGLLREQGCAGRVNFYDDGGRVCVVISELGSQDMGAIWKYCVVIPGKVGGYEVRILI